MPQITINFPTKLDIPVRDCARLHLANAGFYHHKQTFYEIKQHILNIYARSDGWDIQTIKKKCWSCGGTGNYYTNVKCWDCSGTGIYSNVQIPLKRFLINQSLFHQPQPHLNIGELPSTHIISHITGLVKHPECNPAYRLPLLYLPLPQIQTRQLYPLAHIPPQLLPASTRHLHQHTKIFIPP